MLRFAPHGPPMQSEKTTCPETGSAGSEQPGWLHAWIEKATLTLCPPGYPTLPPSVCDRESGDGHGCHEQPGKQPTYSTTSTNPPTTTKKAIRSATMIGLDFGRGGWPRLKVLDELVGDDPLSARLVEAPQVSQTLGGWKVT